MAAGFSLQKEKFDLFKKFLNKYKIKNLKNKKKYISKISSLAINTDFIKDINKLAPFGNANRKPVFLLEKFKIYKPKIINETHIFCLLKDNKNKFFESFAFNSINTEIGKILLNYKKEINLLCEFNLNSLNRNKINIHIVDIIV